MKKIFHFHLLSGQIHKFLIPLYRLPFFAQCGKFPQLFSFATFFTRVGKTNFPIITEATFTFSSLVSHLSLDYNNVTNELSHVPLNLFIGNQRFSIFIFTRTFLEISWTFSRFSEQRFSIFQKRFFCVFIQVHFRLPLRAQFSSGKRQK